MKVEKYLKKSKLLVDLNSFDGELKTDIFYTDKSKWNSGLFAWRSQLSDGAYVMFKTVNDSMVLLIGSANHLLGEGKTSERIAIGTTTSYLIFGFLPYLMATYTEADEKIINPSDNWTIPKYLDTETYPLVLGSYCLDKIQNRFPLKSVNLVFTLYEHYEIGKTLSQENISDEARDWQNLISEIGVGDSQNLKRFNHLYVGSPLYSALGN